VFFFFFFFGANERYNSANYAKEDLGV